MSRMRSIIFMLCSVLIFVSIYAGDTADANAAQEQTPEQQQQETAPEEAAPEKAPKQEAKPETTPPTQEEPKTESKAESDEQPQDEATDAVQEVTEEESVKETVETAPQEQPAQDEIVEEEEVPEIEPAAPEFKKDEVVVLEPTEEESVPLPPEPASEPMVEDLEVVEPQGIDTVDINKPKGNWLFKRIWWEKSKELFGKIRDYVDKIVESRMHFFEERVKLDRDRLDPFYVTVGLDQGALVQQVDHWLSLLQGEREADGLLNEQELELYNVLIEEKVTLNQLQEAVFDIQRIDAGLDKSLQILMEQINLARAYEREAWQLLNQIAEELSDKKAREDYYAIATIWRNVKEVGVYITGAFAKHFVRLASSTVQRVDQVQDTLELLKEKGVELSKQEEQLHQHSCELEEDEEVEEIEEQPESVGWFEWIWQTVTGWFTW